MIKAATPINNIPNADRTERRNITGIGHTKPPGKKNASDLVKETIGSKSIT